jgi:vacuolar-type H+-ATPase subunit I/STV1
MTADKELPQIRQKLSDTNIPFDHPCTAGIVAKSDALLAEVTEMKIHFEKIQQAKQQLQDPGQFPNLQTDLQTLEAWKVNYGFRQFRRNPERFGQLAKDLPHATTQLHAIHKKYSLLMTQPFTHAQTMKREIQWTQVSIQKFVDQTQAYLKNSIQKIEDINQNANEWAQSGEGRLLKRAKDELNEVEPDLRAIEAILTKPQDIQKIQSLKTAHAAAKAKVNGQISRHRQAVLASTRLPDEVYTGSDKESLRT